MTTGSQAAVIALTNPSEQARPNAIVTAPASLAGGDPAPGVFTGTTPDGRGVAVQLDDLDGDGRADELALVTDMGPAETLDVAVDLERPWTGESYTEARLDWLKEDWAVLDNNRIMYRLYEFYKPEDIVGGLQWDCYGKRPGAWRLSAAALAKANYHVDNPVGVDFLKIGNTLGLGGPILGILGEGRPAMGKTARYLHRVICNGPVRSGIEVRVSDWTTPAGGTYEATIRYFLYAHNDPVDARFEITPKQARGERFGLGIVRHKDRKQFAAEAGAGILAAWGQQDTVFGETGLAVLFVPAQFHSFRTLGGELDSEAVLLDPSMAEARPIEFRTQIVGVWEYGGLATAATFRDHLHDLSDRFLRPVAAK